MGSKWLAGRGFETAVLVKEKERCLWADKLTDSSRPQVSIRLTRLVIDKTYCRRHRTRAERCSHTHDGSGFRRTGDWRQVRMW